MIYYVDSRAENGDGKSEKSPLTSAENLTLLPGDSLLFARGSVFRTPVYTASGTAENPIRYGAYGDGEKPRFDFTVDLKNAEIWENIGQNLWKCNLPIPTEVCHLILDGGMAQSRFCFSEEELLRVGDFYDSRHGTTEHPEPEGAPVPMQRVLLVCPENPARYYRSVACTTDRCPCFMTLSSHTVIEGISFYGCGHHALAGAGEDITVRDCVFEKIGGVVWRNSRKIRFGNAIEFWNLSRKILIEDCIFDDIYDSAVTHQGGEACQVTEDFTVRHCTFRRCGMAAYEGRDLVPRNFVFTENRCELAGEGFSHVGIADTRMSEIYPEPMGHHVFLWRMERPTPGGRVEISHNTFGSHPHGESLYLRISQEAESQIFAFDNAET